MTLTNNALGGDCPRDIIIHRPCEACGHQVDRQHDMHVVIMRSWQRCNDVLCRSCWLVMIQAAEEQLRQLTFMDM